MLKLAKLVLTVVGHVMACVLEDKVEPPSPTPDGSPAMGNHTSAATPPLRSNAVGVLRSALLSVPNQSTEYMMRQVAGKLAQSLAQQVRQKSFIFEIVIYCCFHTRIGHISMYGKARPQARDLGDVSYSCMETAIYCTFMTSKSIQSMNSM